MIREKIERYYIKVLLGRRTGVRASAFKGFLAVLSVFYRLGIGLRSLCYRIGIFRSHSVRAWVISVGNITLGGTGKTPVVQRLAALLHARGRKVAVVSRGYRRKTGPRWKRFREKVLGAPTTRVVSDGRQILLNSRVAGDEPYQLAANLEGIPVLINRSRVKAALYASRRLKADTIIMDDGFQHLSLKRDLDIVLVDAQRPFGNRWLFPRGVLREPLGNLSRADLLLITKAEEGAQEDLKLELRRHNPRAEILECRHNPVDFCDARTSIRASLEYVRGMKAAALAGIADPYGFERMLEDLGVEVIYFRRFADHHFYTQQELIDILNEASTRGAEILLTTEKDAVRFPRLPPGKLPVYYLRIQIESVREEGDFAAEILQVLRRRQP